MRDTRQFLGACWGVWLGVVVMTAVKFIGAGSHHGVDVRSGPMGVLVALPLEVRGDAAAMR